MFLFINDTSNYKLNTFISNSSIAVTCSATPMAVSNGYFTSTNCTSDLTIISLITGALLYYK